MIEKARTKKYVAKEKRKDESSEAKCGRRRMDQRVGTANIVARTGCGVFGSCRLKA